MKGTYKAVWKFPHPACFEYWSGKFQSLEWVSPDPGRSMCNLSHRCGHGRGRLPGADSVARSWA
jgi:hypothetical protein